MYVCDRSLFEHIYTPTHWIRSPARFTRPVYVPADRSCSRSIYTYIYYIYYIYLCTLFLSCVCVTGHSSNIYIYIPTHWIRSPARFTRPVYGPADRSCSRSRRTSPRPLSARKIQKSKKTKRVRDTGGGGWGDTGGEGRNEMGQRYRGG